MLPSLDVAKCVWRFHLIASRAFSPELQGVKEKKRKMVMDAATKLVAIPNAIAQGHFQSLRIGRHQF
ncbi:hypothetical protein O9929_23360 [Vibrio lentus]|nr:hypothetical protein [Vibrio lentus]